MFSFNAMTFAMKGVPLLKESEPGASRRATIILKSF